jgi:ribosome production factor 2
MAVERLIKPKNARAKRALAKRAPKTVEVLKRALLLHSGKTSGVMKSLLCDLGAMKAGESLKLSRKNEGVRPFEGGGEASLEFLTRKADCSLFALASHSKKRPHNLVLGRTYDSHLLDMVEFGVRTITPSQSQQSHALGACAPAAAEGWQRQRGARRAAAQSPGG